MSEIEKLMQNAGVKICKRKQGFTLKDCTDRHCKECGYYDMPPFTAEKQLEIIKLLSDREIYINHAEDKYFIFTMNIGGNECSKDFATTLVKYINHIWRDLTKSEKAEIKRILK